MTRLFQYYRDIMDFAGELIIFYKCDLATPFNALLKHGTGSFKN